MFRIAGNGTVFLDEIAQLPPGTQSELLRAIEYQQIMPVGGSEAIKVQARIIAATSEISCEKSRKAISRRICSIGWMASKFVSTVA